MNLTSFIYLIYLFCMLYSALKKWWELAGGAEMVQLNQKDIYYLCMKIDFFQVHGKRSWWFCRMFNKSSHREKVIEIVTRFSIFF